MNQERTKRWLTGMDIVIGLVTLVLVGGGIWLSVIKKDTAKDLTCGSVGAEHELIVANDAFSSKELTVKRCDTLKVINKGTEEYEFAFGTHEAHVPYAGFRMQSLRPNEYFVIDAVQTGTYRFHDHLRDKAHVMITIQ